LLQDEVNRSLSVVELSRRAGYAGPRQWFKALEDESFRAEIETSECDHRVGVTRSSCPDQSHWKIPI
jgi:hypothetical protein